MAVDPWSCVALSSPLWTDSANNFLLWQATQQDVILFTPKSPTLAKDPTSGRYQASVVLIKDPTGGGYKGGSVTFAVDTSAISDQTRLKALQAAWAELIANSNEAGAPKNPQFRSLVTQNAKAALEVANIMGTWHDPANEAQAGTPGGLLAFNIDLTKDGANAFYQALSSAATKTGPFPVDGALLIQYQYLRLVPECSVTFHIDGKRLFDSISSQLTVTGGNVYVGGSLEISAAWQKAQADGVISIKWNGTAPTGLGIDPADLLKKLMDLSLKPFFDMLFKPAPDITPAKAGNSKGALLGINFAFDWKSSSDAKDLDANMDFNGATWLPEEMDVTLAGLFSSLDSSYLIEVNEQVDVPVVSTLRGGAYVEEAVLSITPRIDGAWVNGLPDASIIADPKDDPTIPWRTARTKAVLQAHDPNSIEAQVDLTINYVGSTNWKPIHFAEQVVGGQARNSMYSADLWRETTILNLQLIDAKGNALGYADPKTNYLSVNFTLHSPTYGDANDTAPKLTLETPHMVSWPKTLDTPPKNDMQITMDGGGVLFGKQVSFSNLTLPPGSQFIAYQDGGKGFYVQPTASVQGMAVAERLNRARLKNRDFARAGA